MLVLLNKVFVHHGSWFFFVNISYSPGGLNMD